MENGYLYRGSVTTVAGNANLNSAKTARKDEFYTQLTDIEKEMRYYRKHFAGKTVFCNCDDPFESNFFKYFVLNFNRLGLKKLIATCYSGSPIANQQLSIFDVVGTCILRRPAAADALHQRPPCVGSAATLKWSFEA